MADPLVATDVCRYTVNQTYQGRKVANVIDMVVLGNFDPAGRGDAVSDTAGDVMDAWDQYIRGAQSSQLTCDSVSWVDLDDIDGSTGIITSTTDTSWPSNGGADGDPLPSNVSMLFTKETVSRRGTRAGRMYVAGLVEAFCVGNLITTGFMADLVEAGDLFTEALTETGVAADYQNFPTVVHTRRAGTPEAPVLVYEGNTQVTSFSPQRQVATQRRRLRG